MKPLSAFHTRAVLGLSLLLAAAACDSSPTAGPDGPAAGGVLVLNSTGQTLASFNVQDRLEASGSPIDLGAGFDGEAFDLSGELAVTTVSSFGGSRLLFVGLGSRQVLATGFPGPEADRTNPSAPSFDSQGTAWVGGRGSDAVYRARPGDAEAQRIASRVGTFVEQVIPVGEALYVVDANIDDDGGTYQPLGPGRVVVLSRTGSVEAVIDLPAGAFNSTEAVVVGQRLIVLAAGTFDPGTFLPANDGSVVLIDLPSGTPRLPIPLAANGVSLERGDDGQVYITTTSDYHTLDLLMFDPAAGRFERGPTNPIRVHGVDGARVECWSATALQDGRILCTTFSFVEAGRLVLADEAGRFIDEVPSGFGTTDVATR